MLPMAQNNITLHELLSNQATATLSRKNVWRVCAHTLWGIVCFWLLCSIKCKSLGFWPLVYVMPTTHTVGQVLIASIY